MDDDDKEVSMNYFMFYKKKLIAKLFGSLNTKYVKYFNKKYELTGRMFESRYKSCLLDEEHFYKVIRYVEVNNFKAGLETTIGEYYWTSIHERLKTRNAYFLSKLPEYFQIENWWDYLTEKSHQKFKISRRYIKSFTQRGVPVGNNNFIQRVSTELVFHFISNPRVRSKAQSLI
tara:strand:+ start:312 stop:833 length:522 start_codon:yes stop_codon:yes gene_type:complete